MSKNHLPTTDAERIAINVVFDKLLSAMRSNMSVEDEIEIKKAYELAVDAHSFQRRKSGEPYIYHPIEVARIAYEEIGLGPTAVICALLHDVVEDTDISLAQIVTLFGPKVGKIVDGLTKLDGTYLTESQQAENFKKVISTLVDDVRVVLIKLCDRLHNMRTIGSMPEHKQLKIAYETEYIYIPLAHRLGLYKIKTELQDICLSIKDPETYAEITAKLYDTEQARNNYIEQFITPIKERLVEEGIDYRITGRAKAISSIYNKLKTKGVKFEEIFDIFAVRIIVNTDISKEKAVCWNVYSIVTEQFTPIPERLKDWITTPKSNGYESLHTTVMGPDGTYVEVQIRTERMDEIAERGFAAHWKYKGVKSQNNLFDKWLDRIRGMLDEQDGNALEFITDIKSNLFSEEVYVFTPKGEMRVLPKGATALDFAFDIHSNVGAKAYSITVNNKLVPMGTKLNSGDQVNITTKGNQHPNSEWLKMVVTGKAKNKIRQCIREELSKYADLGKEIIERKLKSMRISFEDNVDFLAKHYGHSSRLEFFNEVYSNNLNVDYKLFEIENGLFVHKKVQVDPKDLIQKALSDIKRPRKKTENKSKILINNEPADRYEFSFATCCNPVQGDNIFGYLSSQNSLKIHRNNCSNAIDLLSAHADRVLKVEWDIEQEGSFVAHLVIRGVDSGIGVIQMLTNTISHDLGLNMRSFSIEGLEGYYQGKVSIFVKDKDQLHIAVKAISNLEGVVSVIRSENNEVNDSNNAG